MPVFCTYLLKSDSKKFRVGIDIELINHDAGAVGILPQHERQGSGHCSDWSRRPPFPNSDRSQPLALSKN